MDIRIARRRLEVLLKRLAADDDQVTAKIHHLETTARIVHQKTGVYLFRDLADQLGFLAAALVENPATTERGRELRLQSASILRELAEALSEVDLS